MQSAAHELLEHASEVRLRLWAPSFAELLAEAGRAVAELELRGANRRLHGPWRTIEVHASDRASLLVDWMNELILRAERDRWVALAFDVADLTEASVRARARGATVEHAPHRVKAATLHDLRLTETAGGCEAEVTLDV